MRLIYEILIFVGIFLVVAIIGSYEYFGDIELEKNHRYTIGVVTLIDSYDIGIHFYYQVNNHKYFGTFTENAEYEGNIKVGTRIFVKFTTTNPDYGNIPNCFIRVPLTLKAPDNGWKVLPKSINKSRECGVFGTNEDF